MAQYPSGINPADYPEPFAGLYRQHLQHLQLKGLRPKTIEAYARAMRRIGAHFDYQVSALTQVQLADYFTQLKAAHSWSGVKLDLYGLKFFTEHVLRSPCGVYGVRGLRGQVSPFASHHSLLSRARPRAPRLPRKPWVGSRLDPWVHVPWGRGSGLDSLLWSTLKERVET